MPRGGAVRGPGAPYQNYPVFAAPPAIAALDRVHGLGRVHHGVQPRVDQGYDGLVRTADLLERAGVGHVGTFRTLAERRQPVIFTTAARRADRRRGRGTYGLNGFPLPEGRPWSVSMWDARNLIAQARAAQGGRRRHRDRASTTAATSTTHAPNADQVALVRALTASPYVDLVLGEHAHVVQPITKVNGKWVVYGMGNMIAQNEVARPRTYEGITRAVHVPRGPTRAGGRPTRRTCRRTGTTTRRAARSGSSGWCGRWQRGVGDRPGCEEALPEIREAVDLLGHAPGLEEQ